MCGFVAILSPAVPVREDLLTVMRDRLIHRGPDNGANWLNPARRIALAHRRLSIIDTSHAADQPMSTEDGALRLIFNGEIYNYVELREELKNQGVTFRTQSDTEVLLAALRQWGEDALVRLNGMFAFALWDEQKKAMLVARDRFGEKPLFIGRGRFGLLIFASEMKAILTHPLMNCRRSEEALKRFGNGTWYEDDDLTFFEDIRRLPPAHAAWFNADGHEQRRWRYWTPDYSTVEDGIKPREAVVRFAELMQRSVRLRLRADVPVGSSLSGGLDSSVIVGLLALERRSSAFTQNTFSACFPSDPTISEHEQIAAVAAHANVNSFLVAPDPNNLEDECRLLHWHQEEPFLSASIYLQWCVARLAKQHRTTVLLDGQGADELLAGYQFYFKQRQLDLLDQGQRALALRETAKFNRRMRMASSRYVEPERRFNPLIAYSNDELTRLGPMPLGPTSERYSIGTVPARPGLRLRRMLSEALLYNSMPMLLRYVDRNAMAHSVETRLPYLDYDLVEFCLRLPDNLYIRNGWQKWILRMAAGQVIPQGIRWRADKVGYAAPLDNWLRTSLRLWGLERLMDSRLAETPGYDRQIVSRLWEEHQQGKSNHSWALWRWISMVEWLEMTDGGCWRAGAASWVPSLVDDRLSSSALQSDKAVEV